MSGGGGGGSPFPDIFSAWSVGSLVTHHYALSRIKLLCGDWSGWEACRMGRNGTKRFFDSHLELKVWHFEVFP